jgi:hypothetical protein
MEEWAAGFDVGQLIDEYLNENPDIIVIDPESGEKQIDPEAGEQLTRGLRQEVDSLPEREESDTVGDVRGNVALAKIDVDDSSFWVAAVSGKRLYDEADEENPLLPGPFQDEREIDHRDHEGMRETRMFCAEPKILEHVLSEFDEGADGRVVLYTERELCDKACKDFIQKFRDYFDNEEASESGRLELNISHTFEG